MALGQETRPHPEKQCLQGDDKKVEKDFLHN